MRDGPSLPGASFQIENLRYHHFYLTEMLIFDLKDCSLEEKNFSKYFVPRSARQSDFEIGNYYRKRKSSYQLIVP